MDVEPDSSQKEPDETSPLSFSKHLGKVLVDICGTSNFPALVSICRHNSSNQRKEIASYEAIRNLIKSTCVN